MKTLSFQQPWASIICSGLKHVENRSWGLSNLPVRILIHAGAKKNGYFNDDDNMPEQWLSLVRNARIMGYLPEKTDLPYSAILGWADVVRCDEPGKNDSEIWADNNDTGWVLEKVHVFDKPIENVKGKLGLFDYPLDEDSLPPSHPAIFKDPEVKGDEVIMPINDKLWESLVSGEMKEIIYDLTDDNAYSFMDENWNIKPFKKITLTNNGCSATYELTGDTFVDTYIDENEQPYMFTGLDGQECQWVFVQFALGERIK